MKVITANRPVECDSYYYKPFVRYIVSDYEAMFLVQSTPSTQWDVSSFNPYEKRYGGQDLNGKKVVVYRHTAYGDQLMISSVVRYLKGKYPDVTIHFYCDGNMEPLWRYNPFIGGAAIPIPIPFDVARAYDYHIFYEGMLENNGEFDQNCCYDDFFNVIGMPNIPDRWKRPHVIPRPEDYKFATDRKMDLNKPYLVYHLAPANKNRCYPPSQGAEFIRMFLDRYTDWEVFIVGRESDKEAVMGQMGQMDRVVDLVNETKSFRDLIPILESANVVVAPDSSVMHLAACFEGVPTVSLWGPFHPNDRAKYYANHHPIFKPDVCEFAACHNHTFTLPLEKCTKATNWEDGSKYCAVLSNIKPEDILEKVEDVIS